MATGFCQRRPVGDGPPTELAWLPKGNPRQETVASHNGPIRLNVPRDAPPGLTMLRVTFDFKVVQPTTTRAGEPPGPDVVLAEWRQRLTLPVRVAAPDEGTIGDGGTIVLPDAPVVCHDDAQAEP